jgi:segregation and condensation protein A
VSFQVAGHQTDRYQVQTDLYQGPLDLLLELIERAELDITRLALAQVTDPYLAYLRQLQEQDAAEVSAFLVIAARLVQIKSAALLPRPTVDPSLNEEEDPGEALARQLIQYKRFKELAGYLNQREESNLRSYLRLADAPKIPITVHLDLTGLGMPEFVTAAYNVFFGKPNASSLDRVVSIPRVTIREKIQAILERLRQVHLTTFRSMLPPGTSRVEVVVTFLALLELVKRRIVSAEQSTLFADIQVEPLADLTLETETMPIEFEGEGEADSQPD